MMKRLLGSRALQEKPQKPQYNPEFEGFYTLTETQNIGEFSSHAFANIFHKICFHTGFREEKMIKLLGKTLIQAHLQNEGCTTMVWTIHFDDPLKRPSDQQPESSTSTSTETATLKKKTSTKKSSTSKEPKPVQVFHVQEELSQLDGGLVYSIKFKLGDEFTMILPITGEKVKSVIRRKTNPKFIDGIFYEQYVYFPNGVVEAVYTKAEKGGLRINLQHQQSRIDAEVHFKKIFNE